jgi:hypothetical protein
MLSSPSSFLNCRPGCGQSDAPLIFLNSFLRDSTNHVAFFGKARFPSAFVCYGGQNLRGDRILLVLGQRADFFQRLFPTSSTSRRVRLYLTRQQQTSA